MNSSNESKSPVEVVIMSMYFSIIIFFSPYRIMTTVLFTTKSDQPNKKLVLLEAVWIVL